MTTEILLKDSIKDIIPITKEIDSILNQCQPIMRGEASGIANSFVLAKGMYQLKEILLNDTNLRKTIEYMQDSNIGFMTDRSPAIIEKAKAKNRTIKPYTYLEISDCVLTALLFGYNLFGKEFYVIGGNFYASQYGKYRHIMENKYITDFSYANSPPIFKTEMRKEKGKAISIQYAEVECFASWNREGKTFYLGKHPDNKKFDPLVFKIKVDAYMGDDGVIGKALSKLFTRVLARLSCNYISSPMLDVPDDTTLEIIESTPAENLDSKSELMVIIKAFEHNGISEDKVRDYFNVDDLLELDNHEGLIALSKAITDIEGRKPGKEPADFLRTAAERKEIKEKE
jgi:hypothetical protein